MLDPLIRDFLVNGERQHVVFSYSAIAALITQEESVSEAEHERRTAICRSCPQFHPDNDLCGVCGFNAPIRAAWDKATCHRW
jgi:ribosomal protein L37E